MRHLLSLLLLATTLFASACTETETLGSEFEGAAISADEPDDLELGGFDDPAPTVEPRPVAPIADAVTDALADDSLKDAPAASDEPSFDTLGQRARTRLDTLRRARLVRSR